jgi:hypothetical protein
MSSDSVLGSVQQKTSRLKGKKRREGREEGERRKLKKCEEREREKDEIKLLLLTQFELAFCNVNTWTQSGFCNYKQIHLNNWAGSSILVFKSKLVAFCYRIAFQISSQSLNVLSTNIEEDFFVSFRSTEKPLLSLSTSSALKGRFPLKVESFYFKLKQLIHPQKRNLLVEVSPGGVI